MQQWKDMLVEETLLLDDDLWEELVELTGGTINLCYQCGGCTANCPWGLFREEVLSVRNFLRRAQIGLPAGDESLWRCTTCAQCEAYCPRGVKVSDVFRSLRNIAWNQRKVEKGLPSLLWSVFWNDNPWSQPPSHRSQWLRGLEVPAYQPDKHELLLYVGCTASYDRRAQKIARSVVQLLQAARVPFGYLYECEPCCGEAVLSVGHKPYFQEIAKNTLQLFLEKNIHHLVTISPHCYDVFRNHYPPAMMENGILIQHYTQYLAQLIAEGRIACTHQLDLCITFQDPCYLGRHNQEYEAPRLILRAIPGVELVEMERHGVDGLCCGGGGGRMWLETVMGERFSDLRVSEAIRTGASVLATACPFCIVCLEDSAKVMHTEQLKVMDIAEIAAISAVSP
jgi:Fe-S oxidoreductase